MKYENGMIMAEGDYVMAHGRYRRPDGPNWIVVDLMRMKDGIFEEHWDVIQDEATREQSNGLPMFGDMTASVNEVVQTLETHVHVMTDEWSILTLAAS